METITEDVDVLAAGGGTAGHVAAIQAARAGARTALVEMGGQLGGTLTTGLISAPAYFWSRTRQVIAGIGWELVLKTNELDGTDLPDFEHPSDHRPSFHVGLSPRHYALVAEEACLEAGVVLHYHELVTGVRADGDGWEVTTIGKNLQRVLRAREVVDCTGDADLVGMLGLERVRGEVRQPGTLGFRLAGFDVDRLDADQVQGLAEAAFADGRLQEGDFWLTDRPFIVFLRSGGFNQQHIFGADSSTSATQTRDNIEGRRALLRLLRFVRSLPGCERTRVEQLAPHAVSRETWRIVGEQTVTRDDYLAGRHFDDAVCYTYYFIDVHTEKGVEQQFVEGDAVPTIPLGALIPRGSRRLLVAGRTISSDREALSALRIQASCMAMGQATGAAAALATQRGVASRDLPLDDVRDLLRQHGAIVP